MATDLGRANATTANKYDAFVAGQLSRAESRIRLLDLTAGLLGFAALSLAYVVGMVLCDSLLMLSPQARQLALYVFLAVGSLYLVGAVFRPLWLRVNPYYAARQVEQQLPQAKNSIVNWVDLHEQQLPPAIRGALGQRAAKDLSHVDLDRAISGRRAAWMGGLAALFGIIFIASFFLLGPAPFVSLLKRTFNPFRVVGVSTRTQLTIRKPEGGNAVVTVGRGLSFEVEVDGKVPDPRGADAVKLVYRYDEGDPWLERPLSQEPSREWTTSLSALEVRNGLWYKITGGDAETEEYRVAVRAAPAITDFLATYHFRPYVARADEVRRDRELKELHGTEVLLRVRTNRALRDGYLELENKTGHRTVRGEVDPNDAHTLFVRFVLDEDGKYRLYFTSTESEAYSDPVAYPVTAIPDRAPVVELTKPGQDIRLPADALLKLEGKAGDDIGVKALTLRLRVVGGDKLRGQPYRGGGDALRLADGGYPLEVEYEDFVELSRVQSEDGQAVALRAGMELEYWLEARDACDYPHANVSESKHYRVFLTEPEKNAEKRRQEKQQAAQEKTQHEQKQDQQLEKENKQRQEQRQEQQARNQEEENKSKDADKGAAGEPPQPKDGEQGNNSESKDNKGQQGDSKDGASEDHKGDQKGGLSRDDQKIEERIKKALERSEAHKDAKSEDKPDKGEPGEGKGAEAKGAEGGDNANGKSDGQNKGADKQDAKDAGERKDKGQPQAGTDSSQGDKQGESKPGDKSEQKDGDPMKRKGAGAAADDKGKADEASPSGDGKPSGNAAERKDAAQSKPQTRGQGEEAAAGDSKPAGDKEQQSAAAQAKDKGGARRAEAKDEGKRKDDGKTEAKQGGSAAKREQSAAGDAKPSSGKDENEKTVKGESKPDPDAQVRDATAKEIEQLARALDGKDPREREKAKQKLERIEKQAANPEVREKAGETLEKHGTPEGTDQNRKPTNDNASSRNPKKESKDEKDSARSGDSGSDKGPKGRRPDEKNGSSSSSDAKNKPKEGEGSQSNSSSGSEKSDSGRNSSEKNGQSAPKGQGSKSPGRESQGDDAAQGGTQAGGGGERRPGQGDTRGGDEGLPPESKPAKPRRHSAAQMQLEELSKKVNKDILKDAGVSEEAWKKYLESKRKQLTPHPQPRPDTPSAPQQANKLPSMGGRTIQPSASGPGDTHGPDRGQPPPGYRDPFREFTKQMSKKN